jgi:hypothetical protein
MPTPETILHNGSHPADTTQIKQCGLEAIASIAFNTLHPTREFDHYLCVVILKLEDYI